VKGIKGMFGKKKDKEPDERTDEAKKQDLISAVKEGTALARDPGKGRRAIAKGLKELTTRYRLQSLDLVTDTHGKKEDNVHVRGTVNPTYDGDGFIVSPFPPDKVVIGATIGPPRRRAGFEEVLDPPPEAGLPGYERAHLLGAGFGVESPLGVLYAPRYVNQILHNKGIENTIRQSYKIRYPGAQLFLRAEATAHPGTNLLARVVYTSQAACRENP
jgi:hypothetical protein